VGKIKVSVGGKEMDATTVGVQSSSERWNEYLLQDGTVLKLKVVVTDVARVDSAYDAEGNPIYVVKSTNVMTLSAPEDLKRKAV
jgi:hypothetical protein